ncbi:MAG: serine/threonine-protein kinase [Pirellulales bacterium]
MSSTTTLFPFARTLPYDPNGELPGDGCLELIDRYEGILRDKRLSWTEHHRLSRLLGSGGQGVVFLGERRGADQFTLPVAIKVFSPDRYPDARAYDRAMARMAQVAARIAQVQQDNLMKVHNFIDRNRIRLMEMEWIDGFDLADLLSERVLEQTQAKSSQKRWDHINNVVMTAGPVHPRMKPGVAVAVMRDCLAALIALHREGIVHGDIKPSNIMVKRTGTAKLIDIGSAFELGDPPERRTCTPAYAAPEVLERGQYTAQSDLASLGYVLVEMLSGQPLFSGLGEFNELLEAKRFLAQRISQVLPQEVACNELLMTFCRNMIAPDPTRRFTSAEAADMQKDGAGAFLRQLIKGDLASEYDSELRAWLEQLD